MVELKSVTKKYGDKVAVNNLSLCIPDGIVCGLLGANGAGKTTTIRMLTGIETQYNGQVFVNGIDILKKPIDVKSKIAYVPDEPTFFTHMSAIDHLNFIANIFCMPKDKVEERIKFYSDLFRFQDQLKSAISAFSHGTKQKLSIIAALIHEPEVIILDEPMVGLDVQTAHTLKSVLKEYALKGNTVIYATHILDLAERFCDEIVILKQGNLVFNGSFSSLQEKMGEDSSTLEEMFLELTNENSDL